MKKKEAGGEKEGGGRATPAPVLLRAGSLQPQKRTEQSDAMEPDPQYQSEIFCAESAYGSPAMDTDAEEGYYSSAAALPYDENLMHKVIKR